MDVYLLIFSNSAGKKFEAMHCVLHLVLLLLYCVKIKNKTYRLCTINKVTCVCIESIDLLYVQLIKLHVCIESIDLLYVQLLKFLCQTSVTFYDESFL